MSWNDDRPMSPHLQVYKLPFTAKLSILHRMSGAILFFLLFILVALLFILSFGLSSWSVVAPLLATKLSYAFFITMTYALYYHLCNGIRHLVWDSGKYMGKEHAFKSGMLVIFSAGILTLLTWGLRFYV